MATAFTQMVGWAKPTVPVQELARTGASAVPPMYVRPLRERPHSQNLVKRNDVPVIDLAALRHGHAHAEAEAEAEAMRRNLADACESWGVFHAVNHGVATELLDAARHVSRRFFMLPLDQKLAHANDPVTYVGYGSRLGSANDSAVLDWGDYYFHHLFPLSIRDEHKWPSRPQAYRETMKEYGKATVGLYRELLQEMSHNLGLDQGGGGGGGGGLLEALGGEVAACVRLNYYPPCPQPQLTLGLSSHSDPGCVTLLLQDPDSPPALHVRHGDDWVVVPPLPDSFTVILGDQIEILTNGVYKSADHRVAVSETSDRVSIAMFCNPMGHQLVGPIPQLVDDIQDNPCKYSSMIFEDYRKFIRTGGARGKTYLHTHSSVTN